MRASESRQRAEVQGYQLRNQAEQLGLNSFWKEILEETDSSNQETVEEQFQIYTASLAVNEVLKEQNLRPLEIGGGAVLNYLLDEEGPEAFEQWRGTGDSDKRIAAEGIEGGYRDIERIIEETYGPRNEKGRTVTHTGNSRHEGEKYTVRLSTRPGEQVELDLMRPHSQEDEEFDYHNTEELAVADTSIEVPTLEDLFVSKLTTYFDSGREKDKGDMASLLYVQEQRNRREETDLDAKDLYEICEDEGLGDEYLEALDQIEEDIPFRKASGNYAPSEDYIDF